MAFAGGINISDSTPFCHRLNQCAAATITTLLLQRKAPNLCAWLLVRERILLMCLPAPGESDVLLLLQASRYYYEGLIESGVRTYEYDAALIHAKTAVIDGRWPTVGSSNLDFRSFVHNDEANAVVIGEEFGKQMRQMFIRDLLDAREVDAQEWAERPIKERIKQRAAALLKYWI